MRFLMLNWRDPRNPLAGGAERVSAAFLGGLLAAGHHVDWFAYDFEGARPEEEIDGIRVHRAGGVFTSVLAARRWFRGQPRFDLVIDQHHGIPWYAPWWCGTSCVAYIHEVLGPIWRSFYRWPTSGLGRIQERWTHWFYRRIPFWVPSESTRDAVSRHGVREVHVFPNGVDVAPLSELPAKGTEGPIRLVTVSRLAPNKRVDHAVRCTGLLRERGIPAELTIVGDGSEMSPLRELVKNLGLNRWIRFVGYRPESEKLDILAASHALIHPSVREGWGLNVIEANAMGTPAVVYPVAGLVDSTLNGETGCVSLSESPEALTESVAWLVGDGARYERVRRAAWARSGAFRWEVVIPPVVGFLERLARGQKLV
ncbi:MAG: glycosyltransferase family 4 protein [Limisphaerales bacterium]